MIVAMSKNIEIVELKTVILFLLVIKIAKWKEIQMATYKLHRQLIQKLNKPWFSFGQKSWRKLRRLQPLV